MLIPSRWAISRYTYSTALLFQSPSDLRSEGLSWTIVTAGIASFVVQYAASGALEAPLLAQHLVGLPMLDLVLGITALLQWYSFDRTLQGAPNLLTAQLQTFHCKND